jgi:hypothetical protein
MNSKHANSSYKRRDALTIRTQLSELTLEQQARVRAVVSRHLMALKDFGIERPRSAALSMIEYESIEIVLNDDDLNQEGDYEVYPPLSYEVYRAPADVTISR